MAVGYRPWRDSQVSSPIVGSAAEAVGRWSTTNAPRPEAVLRDGQLEPACSLSPGIAAESGRLRASSRSSPSSREIARNCSAS